ncbi:MAG: response regulator [Verrucomicrobiales bacterium]|nr:response regulator [Verrucomicrobiales bacterium]
MKKQYPEYGILYVDDEMKSLKYFEAIFEGLAPIYLANSPEEGFAVFQEHHARIGVVISDKKMPGESGIELLKRMRKVDPKPLRFLVTAFSDLDAAVDALNDGLLYSYLTKPWDPDDLENRLSKALSHFCLERERELLIREKSEAFQQLLMADKAASIGILSAGLNHHLRNALTVLRTFYDLLPFQLQDEIEGEPKDRAFWCDFYEEVGGQIERMTSILSNLSEGTKMSSLRLEGEIDLAATLRDAGELVLQGRPDIRFKLDAPEDLPLIQGDAQKLAQMARFLFEEARSVLKRGGEVEIFLSSIDGGRDVQVMFLDNGDPVPEEDLPRLFDPFYVRANQPEELGTNLMACYLTVFHHGGTIRAERATDGRNAVIFSIPVSPEPENDDEVEPTPRMLWRLADFSSRDLRAAGAVLPS